MLASRKVDVFFSAIQERKKWKGKNTSKLWWIAEAPNLQIYHLPLPNLLAEVLDVIQEDFTHLSGVLIRKCLVTNKRWSWRKEAGGWGGGSWRSVAHLNPPSLRRFLQFGKVRNTKTSKLPGNQIFNFVATVDLFVFLPKALQSAGNFTHDITHSPATDSFTSCIYLPWVPFKKTCWVKKTSGKSDAFK